MRDEPTIRVFFEPKIPLHDPELYAFERIDHGVSAETAGGPAALERYREDDFSMVRGLLSVSEVRAARTELEAMALADAPACDMIWCEGALRDHLVLDPSRDREADGRMSGAGFHGGQQADRLPAVDPTLRARFVRKLMGFVERMPALTRLARHPALLALVERLAGGLRIHFKRRDWQICDTDVETAGRVAVPMVAGDVLLFDGKIPHGTPINRTEDFRWAVQYYFRPSSAALVDDAVRLEAFGSEGKDVTC